MKKLFLKAFVFVSVILLTSANLIAQNDYVDEWKEVKSLVDKGLPKSALSTVDELYKDAKAENNTAQFVKAILYRIRLVSDYEEDFLLLSINDLNEEIAETGGPGRHILHSVLAELYWRFYQANRYKILNRTYMAVVDKDDIHTWDLRTLVDIVIAHYDTSLEDSDLLKNTPLEEYDAILVTGKGSKEYRPTLFDFLAHRAADFFMNEESGLIQPADRFQLDSEDYLFPSDEFSRMSLSTHDTLSLKFQAMIIFQGLEKFHLHDKKPKALIDVELKRLKFVRSHIVIPERDSLYLITLLMLKDNYDEQAVTAEIILEIAREYFRRGLQYKPFVSDQYRWDIQKALEYCNEAINRFPKSDGAQNCLSMLPQINDQQLSLITHYAVIPGEPVLGLLSYKNIEDAYFRILSIDPAYDQTLRKKYRNEELIREYKKLPLITEWHVSLPESADHQTHAVQIKLPEMQPGYYIVLISPDKKFSQDTKPVAYKNFWSSNISYIHQQKDDGSIDLYVLHRSSGNPLKNVEVTAYSNEYDYAERTYNLVELESYITDKTGFLNIPKKGGRSKSFYLKFVTEGETFMTDNYFYQYSRQKADRETEKTFFFTDRAIYRPGQTVYFKAIVLEKTGDQYKIKPDHRTTITFYNVNNQKVSELDLKTNEFGSVNGTFTAPDGVLTGQMRIANTSGSAYFSVEEYKRPRFEVVFEPVEGSYKLNEEVTMTGKAMAYAGNPVDHALVNYRVVRTARFPFRDYRWFWPGPPSPEMEILNGVTETDENGKFSISFEAIPDLSIHKNQMAVFDYKVIAGVTDINGETHTSEKRVSVGYKSLMIKTDVPENVNHDQFENFQVRITNLNGTPVSVKGNVKIHRLQMPDLILRTRDWQRPDVFVMTKEAFINDFPKDIYDNEDDPAGWNSLETVLEMSFDTGEDSMISVTNSAAWQEGRYKLVITSQDEFGETVEKKHFFTLFSAESGNVPEPEMNWFTVLKDSGEPGETASLLIGSAEQNRLLYEIVNKGKVISREWLKLKNEKISIEIPIKEEYRGNFGVNLLFIKDNRSYVNQEVIHVPYTNKELDISFGTFRSKLLPGASEKWNISIRGRNGEKIAAELLAGMYDASLDVFRDHQWAFSLYKAYSQSLFWSTANALKTNTSRFYKGRTGERHEPVFREYDQLNWFGFRYYGYGIRMHGMRGVVAGVSEMMVMDQGMPESKAFIEEEGIQSAKGEPIQPGEGSFEKEKTKTGRVPIRRNFQETAFFYPDLRTNEEGDIIIEFTAPESLTEWKFMALAHTQDLMKGMIEKELVTQKDLMVVPNPPRFLREGDKMSFSAKIVSLSDKDLSGKAMLVFFDAFTMQPVTLLAGPHGSAQNFNVEKGMSTVISWEIEIPAGLEALVYQVTAKAGKFSDGEEMAIPVLPNRMMVTESLPLPINGPGKKEFSFHKLLQSGASTSIKSYRLTLEFTSNPAWYAVQALPYLMEFTNACSEQVFSRFYANSLASYIANSNPDIKRIFDNWKKISPEALLSNLEKNQQLKSVLLEETPWVMQAKNETERKKRIALLFDLNKMSNDSQKTLRKLQEMQLPNGAWPWFNGMRENRYITQHIVTGIGKLHHLGVIDLGQNREVLNMMQKALRYMDEEIERDYERIMERDDDPNENHTGNIQIQYLYAKSFYTEFSEPRKINNKGFDYFKEQVATYWTERNKYMQGIIALALFRLEGGDVPGEIVRSLKEHALYSEEIGMYWRGQAGYSWDRAPIERQALLIEVFDEIPDDQVSVEKMKVWLLKQKQTQDWKTTRATADAIYALLLKGTDLLASKELVEVSLGYEKIDPLNLDGTSVEAGTGYFQTSWAGSEITPEMGQITVTKKDKGIAWGAVYWQYFEDLDKIIAAATPLHVEKHLFLEQNTASGPELVAVDENTPLKTGDKIISRIIIRTDRHMEYIHLKDMRAAAFEPVNVLSGYHYQGGLGYYESTLDASVNFFIDHLPKGTFVLEYPLTITQEGEFSNGITTIQCMYAPEFSAHTEGVRVKVVR